MSKPCLDCPDRALRCHSTCEKYKQAGIDDPRKIVAQAKQQEQTFRDYLIGSVERVQKSNRGIKPLQKTRCK